MIYVGRRTRKPFASAYSLLSLGFLIYFQEELRSNHSKVIVDEVFCRKNVVFFQDFNQSQSV